MKIMGVTIKKALTFLPGSLFWGSFQKAMEMLVRLGLFRMFVLKEL